MQNQAPFWSALVAYYEAGVIPFHTPGHKLHSGAFKSIEDVLGPAIFGLDPSDQIENLQLKHDFQVALTQAENLAAELFGADQSMFLVNGTTGGLHYLLMPATGPVLIPRFSHQAVYSSLVLSQGEGVYIPAHYDPDWLIPLPPTAGQVGDVLAKQKCQAMLITHPTYYGTVSDLKAITKLTKELGVLVFADEAHGGHFRFSQDLPLTALECGADAVVQSTHKVLGSLTQTSMLHSNHAAWFRKVAQAKQTLQTTSPSFIFFAILDEVRRVLALQGTDLVGRVLELARSLASQLKAIPGVEVLPGHLQADPTKVVFSLRSLGITGIELEWILRTDSNIQVELSDYYSVLALVALGDTTESIASLVAAVQKLVGRKAHLGKAPLPRHNLEVPDLPPVHLRLREAFFMEKEIIPLQKARGRISGGFLTPYPPGVPVILPGEKFTTDVIEHLSWCNDIGWPIRGLMVEQMVVVLKENS